MKAYRVVFLREITVTVYAPDEITRDQVGEATEREADGGLSGWWLPDWEYRLSDARQADPEEPGIDDLYFHEGKLVHSDDAPWRTKKDP